MELASAAQMMGVQICGAVGCLVTERVVPNTQRIDPHQPRWIEADWADSWNGQSKRPPHRI